MATYVTYDGLTSITRTFRALPEPYRKTTGQLWPRGDTDGA